MPHFTVKASELERFGPVIEVYIVPHRRRIASIETRNLPAPSPIKVSALIDSGANCSVLQVGIAAQLGLTPIDKVRISTPSDQGLMCDRYSVQFLFPAHQYSIPVTPVEAPLKGQLIGAIIGRDVLRNCVFVYQGHDESFTLSF